jgi:hypothetical protein
MRATRDSGGVKRSPAVTINRPSDRLSGPSKGLDPGIREAVERLQTEGIETFESCEEGPGHAYPEPTIRFYGRPEAGWRALAICFDYRLPVVCLRRIWDVLDTNQPTGPYWEITFRRPC